MAVAIVTLGGASYLFWMWWHADPWSDDGYGLFMMAIVALLASIHTVSSIFGWPSLGRFGGSDAGSDFGLLDGSDGDCD